MAKDMNDMAKSGRAEDEVNLRSQHPDNGLLLLQAQQHLEIANDILERLNQRPSFTAIQNKRY